MADGPCRMGLQEVQRAVWIIHTAEVEINCLATGGPLRHTPRGAAAVDYRTTVRRRVFWNEPADIRTK